MNDFIESFHSHRKYEKMEIDAKLNLTPFVREQNTIHVQFPSDYSDVSAFLL